MVLFLSSVAVAQKKELDIVRCTMMNKSHTVHIYIIENMKMRYDGKKEDMKSGVSTKSLVVLSGITPRPTIISNYSLGLAGLAFILVQLIYMHIWNRH